MTTTAVSGARSATARPPMLRRVVAALAPFDGVMGVVCVAAGAPLGRALDVPTAAVEVTGVTFLAAAAAGLWTLRTDLRDVRWIVGANVVFALWCLAVLATDSPNAVGAVLLAASAASALGTAGAEWRLSRR